MTSARARDAPRPFRGSRAAPPAGERGELACSRITSTRRSRSRGPSTPARSTRPPDRRLIATVAAGELSKGTARRTKLEIAEALESRAASLVVFVRRLGSRGPRHRRLGALARHRGALRSARRGPPRAGRSRRTSSTRRRSGWSARSASSRIRPPRGRTRRRSRRIYPPGHPFHRRTGEERIALVESLTREDLDRPTIGRATAPRRCACRRRRRRRGTDLDGLEDRFGTGAPGPARAIPAVPVPPAALGDGDGRECPTRRAPTSFSRSPRP